MSKCNPKKLIKAKLHLKLLSFYFYLCVYLIFVSVCTHTHDVFMYGHTQQCRHGGQRASLVSFLYLGFYDVNQTWRVFGSIPLNVFLFPAVIPGGTSIGPCEIIP